MKKSKFRVERSSGDDVLDALSMRINQDLRTEKELDDKKNNVYFWLFKFLILLVYLVVVVAVFEGIKYLGVNLIYLFAVSLRSVLSFLFYTGVTFAECVVVTYILLKNLKIFTKSTYYSRLYAKDRYMLKRKRKFFGVIESVLQAFGIVHLVFVGIIEVFLVCIITMLVTLAFNQMYMFSLLAICVVLLVMCMLLFEEIKSKFFGYKSKVRKEHLYVTFLALIFALICFGYETNGYKVSKSLPIDMNTITQSFNLTIPPIDDRPNEKRVFISSNAKFNNIELKTDNSLGNSIRFELEYFKTARVSYVNYFNTENNYEIRFDGEVDFKVENLKDVFTLGMKTIDDKTMYNYNMFKYPKVTVYANSNIQKYISIDNKLDLSL